MCSTVRNHCVMPEKFNCTTSLQLGPKNVFLCQKSSLSSSAKVNLSSFNFSLFYFIPLYEYYIWTPCIRINMSMHIDNPVYLCLVCAGDVLHWCYLIIDLDTERQRETRYSSSTSARVCIHVYNRFTGMLAVLCIRLGQFWDYLY